MKTRVLLLIVVALQSIFAFRVIRRMLGSAGGERLTTKLISDTAQAEERVSVIVPVLNEASRLAPCLEGLMSQGNEVVEILVVDGGSKDGTQQLIEEFSKRDSRIRCIDATPIPPDWNGKAWGLQVGLQVASPTAKWILTIDADVRPRALLIGTLLAQALKTGLPALSIATQQEINGSGQGLIHPAFLTTLVYRFGIPGHVINRVNVVQANGQCFLLRRDILAEIGEFRVAARSRCEDVTIARALVAKGYAIGFYEAGELVTVEMYRDWQDTWQNWSRSLPMHDQFSGWNTALGWLEIMLVQALPLPLLGLLAFRRHRYRFPFGLNIMLVLTRIGILCGTTRAYQRRPWSYWLSPVCDVPVVLQLGRSLLKRRHIWRGRTLVRGEV